MATRNPRRRRANGRRRQNPNGTRAAAPRLALARRINARRRRRNPTARGVVVDASYAAVGALVTPMIMRVVPSNILGGGMLVQTGIQLGVAYFVGVGAQRLGVNSRGADMIAIGGFVSAATNLINWALGSVSGMFGPPAAEAQPVVASPTAAIADILDRPDYVTGMGDVVTQPDYVY